VSDTSTTKYDVYDLTPNPHGLPYAGNEIAKDVAITNTGGGAVIGGTGDTGLLVDGTTYTYLGYASLNGATGIVAVTKSGDEVFIVETRSNIPKGAQLYNYVQDNPAKGTGEWNINTGIEPVCFLNGTQILTPEGERPVESLKAGDLVVTASGAVRPILWVGVRAISQIFSDPAVMRPIKIKAGALGDRVPARDLRVSPGHAVLVDGVLATAQALVNGVTILQDEMAPLVFTYHHLELDAHDLLLADGAPAESFLAEGAEMRLDNGAERLSLHLEPCAEMPFPRAKSRRQLPASVRARLLARAVLVEDGVTAA